MSSKEWRDSNKEKIKESNKKWREANKEKLKQYANKPEVKAYQKQYAEKHGKKVMRKYFYKHKYNITIEEYQELFNKQQGCCAICGKHQLEFKRPLSVEHCHITNKVRGLCCQNCNTIIGHAHDDIIVLQKAIKYLNTK